jgi:hypothetical protein
MFFMFVATRHFKKRGKLASLLYRTVAGRHLNGPSLTVQPQSAAYETFVSKYDFIGSESTHLSFTKVSLRRPAPYAFVGLLATCQRHRGPSVPTILKCAETVQH